MADEAFGPYEAGLGEAEFVVFAQALAARQRRALGRRRSFVGFVSAGGALVVIFAVAVVAGALEARAAIDLALACLAAGAVAGFYFRRQATRAQTAAIAGLSADAEARPAVRRIALDAQGVAVETGRRRETHSWAKFESVERLDGLLALWTPLAGFAIPARALGDEADARRVETAARVWIEAARRGTEART